MPAVLDHGPPRLRRDRRAAMRNDLVVRRSHPAASARCHSSTRRKEFHFFDRYWTEDVEPDFAARYARFFPRPDGSITGEWTPGYMCDPWAVPLLAEAAPEARYLIMLRDPVERYRSSIAPVLRRSRERGYDPLDIVIANHSVLHSMYYGQVKRALELLGRDRVLVLQYERCVDDPLAQMQRTQRFLGLGAPRGHPGRARAPRTVGAALPPR